jgi:hypothetical protein
MMSKPIIVLMAAVLALTLSEVAAPADQDKESPQEPRVPQAADPTAGGATASEREWEYLTALQKCELLVDDERSKCVDAARKKYGQM